jgi:hypothetical protein
LDSGSGSTTRSGAVHTSELSRVLVISSAITDDLDAISSRIRSGDHVWARSPSVASRVRNVLGNRILRHGIAARSLEKDQGHSTGGVGL